MKSNLTAQTDLDYNDLTCDDQDEDLFFLGAETNQSALSRTNSVQHQILSRTCSNQNPNNLSVQKTAIIEDLSSLANLLDEPITRTGQYTFGGELQKNRSKSLDKSEKLEVDSKVDEAKFSSKSVKVKLKVEKKRESTCEEKNPNNNKNQNRTQTQTSTCTKVNKPQKLLNNSSTSKTRTSTFRKNNNHNHTKKPTKLVVKDSETTPR